MAVNEDINAMIDQLHARLEDVHAVASATNIELFGFAKRLDKVDDQLYLLQVDMEKFIASQLSETGVVAPAAAPAVAAAAPAAPAEPAEEAAAAAPASAEAAAEDQPAAEAQPKEKKEEGILSESAKETLSSAAKTLGEMFRDSKEVMGEITDVVKDVKDTFDIKGNLTKK